MCPHTRYPPLRVVLLHTSGSSLDTPEKLLKDVVRSGGVVVTTYEQMRRKAELLVRPRWSYAGVSVAVAVAVSVSVSVSVSVCVCVCICVCVCVCVVCVCVRERERERVCVFVRSY